MKTLPNIHPGEVLLEEFLLPTGISQNALVRAAGVPPRRINEIVLGKRSVTAARPSGSRPHGVTASASGWGCRPTTIWKRRIASWARPSIGSKGSRRRQAGL